MTAAVGGGFNGKSTLLQAIEAGVYDKVWHRPDLKPTLLIKGSASQMTALLTPCPL